MCSPGTSTPLRQPNAPQATAQCPPGRCLTSFLFDFSMRQPLVQTFPRCDLPQRAHGELSVGFSMGHCIADDRVPALLRILRV
jgi:hypothetical protein